MRFILNNFKAKVQENRILRPQKSNQMNVRKYIFAIVLSMVALYSCNNDDDDNGGGTVEPPRDRAEQQADEVEVIQKYLETHFYTLIDNPANPDYKIALFDTIAGDNSGRQPISQSDLLDTKTVTSNDVEYTLHILNIRKGATGERQPTFSDSTMVTYRGEVFYDNQDRDGDGIPDLADINSKEDGSAYEEGETPTTRPDADGDGIADDSDADNPDLAGEPDSDEDGIIDDKDPVDNNNPSRRVFDSGVAPAWFDQTNVIVGWREALVDFIGASGFMNNADGTVDYNDDFGNLVVFMPSGLAYFDTPPGGRGIARYAPLIFNIQLYGVNEADHDRDGIPSHLEDLDNDRIVLDTDDNTDGDNAANFQDPDDDNDGTLTRDEITLSADAMDDGVVTLDEITFYDDDGDGTPNHLDADDRDSKNEQ